jgi:hypothetical protein
MMGGHRVELNVTLECNLRCNGCNRLCGTVAPKEHMTLEQIDDFLNIAREGVVSRAKLAGGEPLVWHNFEEGYRRLAEAANDNLFKLVGNTNGTIPVPEYAKAIKWYYSTPKKKRHLPYWHAPIDSRLPWQPCRTPARCGFSLDPAGWLPCSPAIMIARVFGLTDLYRDNPNGWKVWGMDRLCPLCPHAAPEAWRKEHCKPIAEFTEEDNTPSESWAKALAEYGAIHAA